MPARTSSGKAKASMRGDTAFGSFRLGFVSIYDSFMHSDGVVSLTLKLDRNYRWLAPTAGFDWTPWSCLRVT